jgi:hypothetical protein
MGLLKMSVTRLALFVLVALMANFQRTAAYEEYENWEPQVIARAVFVGDNCPTGYVRFEGKCVEKKKFLYDWKGN